VVDDGLAVAFDFNHSDELVRRKEREAGEPKVFADFSTPRELAPARDRFLGILLAHIVMGFVFDRIWPVRTVTAMRGALATILRAGARFLRLPQTARNRTKLLRQADSIRDQIGKAVAGVRSMNATTDYAFGVDQLEHKHASQIIIRAALASVAFWNQLAVLHSKQDRDFLTEPALAGLRSSMADGMDATAQTVVNKTEYAIVDRKFLIDHSMLTHPRCGEYVQYSVARFDGLQNFIDQLKVRH
jgi:multidrug resistance protein MdtO